MKSALFLWCYARQDPALGEGIGSYFGTGSFSRSLFEFEISLHRTQVEIPRIVHQARYENYFVPENAMFTDSFRRGQINPWPNKNKSTLERHL